LNVLDDLHFARFDAISRDFLCKMNGKPTEFAETLLAGMG